jgi:hypothetical protein
MGLGGMPAAIGAAHMSSVQRADEGGMVSAKQLRGLVTLLKGVCGGGGGGMGLGGSVGADICRVCSDPMREAWCQPSSCGVWSRCWKVC